MLQTRLAVSGDRKEELESKAGWQFGVGAVVEGAGSGRKQVFWT